MKKDLFKLLEKYDVPGPRYTSYPTVPAWTESVSPSDCETSLRSLGRGKERLSLYLHIPFCEKLCHFCGCMKIITRKHESSREYVDILLAEMERIACLIPESARTVNQVQLGGGSPNFLQPEELEMLMKGIRRHFRLESEAEVAIEMHPRTSTEGFCRKVAELGFNRISLGVQDLDPKVQKLIHRDQTYEQTRDMVLLLRKLGLSAFNFDLIYGLPGQSFEGWDRTLDQVIEMRPGRLAVYSYAHVPWVKPYQRSFQDSDLPPPKMKLELFERGIEKLTRNGYRLIGMDHFALESDDLCEASRNGTLHRNFMGYSTKKEDHQIGFGVSAISYAAGNYFQNEKEIKGYYRKIGEGALATYRGFLLSLEDRLRRDLIQRIMCGGGEVVAGDPFREDLPKLGSFAEDGLVKLTDDGFRVTETGRLFLRNIAMVFDPYLQGIREKATTPVFSRTV